MQPFMEPGRIWPAGTTRWHLYWLPGSATHELADLYTAALHPFRSTMRILPREWRHATVGAITRPFQDVTAQQLQDVHGELRDRLSRIEPFAVHVGPVWTNMHGVILDMRPDAPFAHLQEETAAVITKVLGDGAAYDFRGAGRPHIALSYATASMDSGHAGSALRSVTDQIATDVVASLHCLDVTQDPDLAQYTWRDPIEILRLDTP